MILDRLPLGRRRRLLTVVGIVVALGGVLLYLTVALERKREVEELVAIRDTLTQLRAAADTCRTELARAETTFRRFDAEVDSLRERVDAFEGLDPEGVPAPRYDAYLETFDAYNEAVEGWESHVDSLRAREGECRRLVERHNLLADSLRRRIAARDSAAEG